MPKLLNISEKLYYLCLRNGFLVKSTLEGPGGFQVIHDYGSLGAELRRNLRNFWWQEMVTSKGSVIGAELSSVGGNHREHFSSDSESIATEGRENSKPTLGLINTSKLAELFLEFLEVNTWDKEELRDKVQTLVAQNCLPCKSKSDVMSEGLSLLQRMSYRGGRTLSVPHGLAWAGKYFTEAEQDDSFTRLQEQELMNLQFICSQKTAQHWINYWSRCRLTWWRKFANNPSNFVLHDQHNRNSKANNLIEIKYNVPIFEKQLETIECITECITYHHGNLSRLFPKDDGKPLCLIQITTNLDEGFAALLTDAYQEKDLADSSGHVSMRTVLSLHPHVAPVKVSVVIEESSKGDLLEISHQLATELMQAGINVTCEDTMSPDKCYAYNDEIGTPYCVTILASTLFNGVIAFRNRNSTLQEYTHISDVLKTVQQHLEV